MKKIFGFLTVSIFSLLALVLFAGCSNIPEEAYVFETNSVTIVSSVRSVTITATSKSGQVSFESVARSITPGAYSSSELNFYIGGQNLVDNSKLVVQKIAFEPSAASANVGTISVPFNSYNYHFVLAAVPTASDPTTIRNNTYIEDILSYAVLSGVAAADLRYSTANTIVNFYLTSDGLTGAGGFSLNFYLKDWSDASKTAYDATNDRDVISSVNIGLYKTTTHSAVTETIGMFRNKFSDSNLVSFSGSGITPGQYELTVKFTRSDKTYVFSDNIFILPCQMTSATIGIPDVLENEPEAPSDFTQGYVLPDNTESAYYKTIFTWTDNSFTEANFEIELLDVSSNENVLVSTIDSLTNSELETLWEHQSTPATLFSYGKNFYGMKVADDSRPVWYAGNLDLNSNYAVFTMQLGKRYLARLRAVNPIGGSSWCYAVSTANSVTLPSGSATAENATLVSPKVLSADNTFNTKIINLYRVSYYLSGGSFVSASIPTNYYFSQSNTGTTIMAPNGTSTVTAYNSGNAVTLKNGDLAWSHWTVNSANGKEYPRVFTKCEAGSAFDESLTYYVTADISASPDANGSLVGYTIANPQPTAHDGNYYIDTRLPANYTNSKNLVLYAVYESSPVPVIIDDDYDMAENLNFTVSAQGTGTQPSLTIDEGDVIRVVRTDGNYTTTSLNLSYAYKSGVSFDYDSVTMKFSKKGGNGIANYSDSGHSFGISLTGIDAGTYNATIYASKSGKNYQYSFTIVLKDN